MSTLLARVLKERIARDGPLTVADYMEACLYDPQHGYYTRGHNFLPVPDAADTAPYPHDFITAAHLPCFAATLAEWVCRTGPAGQPFTLMECGAGTGLLMKDMLTHMATHRPEVFARVTPVLVEVSATLRDLQQRVLRDFDTCRWMDTPAATGTPLVLVANELLDAFPHAQIIEHDGRLAPRQVGLDDAGELAFCDDGRGRVTEHSPAMKAWLQALPQSLEAAVFLDYGAAVDGPTSDTLQAVYRHEKIGVFEHCGDADLTVQVNFADVVRALNESHPHLKAQPLEELAPFLMRYGLASAALRDGMPDAATQAALQRLLHPAGMGALFKVLVMEKR